MANQVDVLEHQLQRVENRTRLIVEAANNQPQRMRQHEMWWQHIIGLYGDEETPFQRVGIQRAVFLDSLALVHNVHWDARGRRGVIQSTRERLFFLMVFLSMGIPILEVLVMRFLKTRGHIIALVKKIAERLLPLLVAGSIRCFDESVPDAPECSLIVDCTVCQIRGRQSTSTRRFS